MEDLSSYIKATESSDEITYFEVYDFVGAKGSGPNLRYITYEKPLNLLKPDSGFAYYKPAGITRTPLTREADLSVDEITITFLDEEFEVIDELINGNDNAVRNGIITCRRVYHTKDETYWANRSMYRTIFIGKIQSLEFTEDGVVTVQASDAWVDWRLSVNKRTFNRMCGYIFKGIRCGYSGGGTFCDKTLTQCQRYNNEDRFGGFKNIDEVVRSGVPFF